jgi:REP element-mobilizing transposase RayT
MPRKARIIVAGMVYHVFCRGNRKQKIFFNNKDRLKFLYILLDAKERFPVWIYALVLMPNHTHYLLEPQQPEYLSKFMHYVNTCFSIYINKKYNQVGHLFQDRFKSIPIDSESYLWRVFAYVHINPAKDGLVERPENYKWSSYPIYLQDILTISPRFYTKREQKILEKLIDKEIFLEHYSSIFKNDKIEAIKECKKFVDDVFKEKIWLKEDWSEHDV